MATRTMREELNRQRLRARRRRLMGQALLVLALGVLFVAPAPLGIGNLSDKPERQRQGFLAAEAALASGDGAGFETLSEGLRDYPLYAYLRYTQLAANLATAEPNEITNFLITYADTPLADRLRRDWLDRLARLGRWPDYLAFHQPDGTAERQCQYLRALIATGRQPEALEQIAPLWLVGRSQPAACDPLFKAWREAGRLTTELVWQRIALAMAADDLRLAGYLGGNLPAADKEWLDRWIAVHQDPKLVEDPNRFATAHPLREKILADGLLRLVRSDPQRATAAWELLQPRYPFPAEDAAEIQAALGLALARTGDDRAMGYLDRVPANAANLAFQERRLREALAREDWTRVADWIARMPDGDEKKERWLYWQARAEEALGNIDAAQTHYRQAAAIRGFWGFLAADRVRLPYNLTHRPTPAADRVRELATRPALARIEELRALGREAELRREWARLTRDLDAADLQAAALIAGYLGWPDRAIATLARSGYWDDLALRFPVRHRDQVQAQAAVTGLPESWIYAIIRQESAFAPTAGSQAGAVGLMQLMPATASDVARQLGRPIPARADLLDPATNIALGANYLAQMQRRFAGDAVLATTAYNAGPKRVRQWCPARPLAADLWIATIPYQETRDYVQRVLAYRLIYANRLGLADGPISAWLAPIGATQLSAGLTPDPEPDG